MENPRTPATTRRAHWLEHDNRSERHRNHDLRLFGSHLGAYPRVGGAPQQNIGDDATFLMTPGWIHNPSRLSSDHMRHHQCPGLSSPSFSSLRVFLSAQSRVSAFNRRTTPAPTPLARGELDRRTPCHTMFSQSIRCSLGKTLRPTRFLSKCVFNRRDKPVLVRYERQKG
jgi:hypothetical protein